MAKLTAKARNALPGSDFAGPDRSYPINNPSHARNALARAAQHASPELEAKIKAKVRHKYPSIKVGGKAAGGVVHGEGDAPRHRADRARRG